MGKESQLKMNEQQSRQLPVFRPIVLATKEAAPVQYIIDIIRDNQMDVHGVMTLLYHWLMRFPPTVNVVADAAEYSGYISEVVKTLENPDAEYGQFYVARVGGVVKGLVGYTYADPETTDPNVRSLVEQWLQAPMPKGFPQQRLLMVDPAYLKKGMGNALNATVEDQLRNAGYTNSYFVSHERFKSSWNFHDARKENHLLGAVSLHNQQTRVYGVDLPHKPGI